jgi:hypothetical protein
MEIGTLVVEVYRKMGISKVNFSSGSEEVGARSGCLGASFTGRQQPWVARSRGKESLSPSLWITRLLRIVCRGLSRKMLTPKRMNSLQVKGKHLA